MSGMAVARKNKPTQFWRVSSKHWRSFTVVIESSVPKNNIHIHQLICGNGTTNWQNASLKYNKQFKRDRDFEPLALWLFLPSSQSLSTTKTISQPSPLPLQPEPQSVLFTKVKNTSMIYDLIWIQIIPEEIDPWWPPKYIQYTYILHTHINVNTLFWVQNKSMCNMCSGFEESF